MRYDVEAMKPRVKHPAKIDSPNVRKRNIPVHIIFWLSVLALLDIFYKAFS